MDQSIDGLRVGRVGLYAGFCSTPVRCGGHHPSGHRVATGLERSTRMLGRAALLRILFDLAPDGVCRAATVTCRAGGLLHHRFTLARRGRSRGRRVDCSLWHWPAGLPEWALPTILPCGVRTFLDAAVIRLRTLAQAGPCGGAMARPTRPEHQSYGRSPPSEHRRRSVETPVTPSCRHGDRTWSRVGEMTCSTTSSAPRETSWSATALIFIG